MQRFIQHCLVLELGTVFTERELKAAYRKQMLMWHPDRHEGNPPMRDIALRKAQEINTAYEHLSELLENGALAELAKLAGAGGRRQAAYETYSEYRTKHTYQGQRYEPGFPDPSVVEIFVKSSHIVSTGFDRHRRILFIKFANGAVYKYFDVAEHLFDEFVAADSHGAFANRHISRVHRYVRC